MATPDMAAAAAAAAGSVSGLNKKSEGWVEIQRGTFTNWLNTKIKDKMPEIDENDLANAMQDGVCLIEMLQTVSGKSMGKFNRNPRLKVHKLENLTASFDFMKKENLTLVNIGPSDIESGNEKLILGLLWTIIYHYQIAVSFKGSDGKAVSGHGKKGGARELMLEWVRSKIPEYNIKNLNKDWNDGRAMAALVNVIAGEPQVIPNHGEMLVENAKRNATTAIDAAEEYLGIPKVLEPEDLVNPDLDELSMMTYLSYFKTATRKSNDNQAVAEPEPEPEPAAAEPEPEPATPAKAGGALPPPWERSADWREYTGVNLGGRCKIRVYFSLTTSSAVYRKRKEEMMALFERMKVHERPDFEPWIPVDMDMDKATRDAIFEKAGTRELPMLFVDDEYVGGYDQVMDLNESNQLEKIFEY
ncbi:uncharacterized protein MONBRDRAFT_36696 [Monosiga brevicollis MX1]|uniref:Calponin-homology (CH) domain-containing protein n=1 Tax=Monosiga brevicollis TaxID=81824 RepID=A9UWY0_MONBE|nr:uncharacterized protein MONBRDRAFT_36696 [Monosiga brevicollis MX1]EDQ90295.1 predicted protein [Monosiga brevicollis MX1]|eukprot:XP_001745062.1 hypothetical protein [Monosiga brevicollis MX1]